MKKGQAIYFRRRVLNTVRDRCGRLWAEGLHARLRETIHGKVREKDLAESVEAVHALVCRFGGPRSFARILHAAVLDHNVDATVKAGLLSAIAAMWTIVGVKFEQAQEEWSAGMTDDDLQAWLGKFSQRCKVREKVVPAQRKRWDEHRARVSQQTCSETPAQIPAFPRPHP